MADEFKVGDVVVRVKIDRDIDPFHGRRMKSKGSIPYGSMVRVADVIYFNEVGLVIQGHPSGHPTGAWSHLGFKKLPKADDTFINQMRSLKPAKDKANVR